MMRILSIEIERQSVWQNAYFREIKMLVFCRVEYSFKLSQLDSVTKQPKDGVWQKGSVGWKRECVTAREDEAVELKKGVVSLLSLTRNNMRVKEMKKSNMKKKACREATWYDCSSQKDGNTVISLLNK